MRLFLPFLGPVAFDSKVLPVDDLVLSLSCTAEAVLYLSFAVLKDSFF